MLALEPESRTRQFFDMINALDFTRATEWDCVRSDARVSDWSNSEMRYEDFIPDLRELSTHIIGPQVHVIDVATYINTPGTTAMVFVHGECLLADPGLPKVKREGLWTLKWRKRSGEWSLSTVDLIKGLGLD